MILPQHLSVQADMTGGHIDCVQLTDGGFRKLLLRLRKGEIEVEISLRPAQADDFAAELQEVLDWLRVEATR